MSELSCANLNELNNTLMGLCRDWSGEQLPDECVPRTEITCKLLRDCAVAVRALHDLLAKEIRTASLAHSQKIDDFAFAKFDDNSIIVVHPNMKPILINKNGEVGTVKFEAVR